MCGWASLEFIDLSFPFVCLFDLGYVNISQTKAHFTLPKICMHMINNSTKHNQPLFLLNKYIFTGRNLGKMNLCVVLSLAIVESLKGFLGTSLSRKTQAFSNDTTKSAYYYYHVSQPMKAYISGTIVSPTKNNFINSHP